MLRAEAEFRIAKKLHEIGKIFDEYSDSNGIERDMLSMTYNGKNGYVDAFAMDNHDNYYLRYNSYKNEISESIINSDMEDYDYEDV